MKTFNYLLVLVCIVILGIGCSHCSRTITHFKGKTTGINPYGSGNATVDRESYWGNLNCILGMMDNAD